MKTSLCSPPLSDLARRSPILSSAHELLRSLCFCPAVHRHDRRQDDRHRQLSHHHRLHRRHRHAWLQENDPWLVSLAPVFRFDDHVLRDDRRWHGPRFHSDPRLAGECRAVGSPPRAVVLRSACRDQGRTKARSGPRTSGPSRLACDAHYGKPSNNSRQRAAISGRFAATARPSPSRKMRRASSFRPNCAYAMPRNIAGRGSVGCNL